MILLLRQNAASNTPSKKIFWACLIQDFCTVDHWRTPTPWVAGDFKNVCFAIRSDTTTKTSCLRLFLCLLDLVANRHAYNPEQPIPPMLNVWSNNNNQCTETLQRLAKHPRWPVSWVTLSWVSNWTFLISQVSWVVYKLGLNVSLQLKLNCLQNETSNLNSACSTHIIVPNLAHLNGRSNPICWQNGSKMS